jgi:hypothetical protein
MTYKVHDIKGLDAKLQQCMAIFGQSPLIAFGGVLLAALVLTNTNK